MTITNSNALELLGKEVSFRHQSTKSLTEVSSVTYTEFLTGTVTNIVMSLNSSLEFSVNNGDFYSFDEIDQFLIKE